MTKIPSLVQEAFELPAFKNQYQIEQVQALLGAWHSSRDVEVLTRQDFLIKDHAPERIRLPKEFEDRTGVVTVLTTDLYPLRRLLDYRIYGSYTVLPVLCPAQGHLFCPLCEGTRVIALPYEWRIVVLLPKSLNTYAQYH